MISNLYCILAQDRQLRSSAVLSDGGFQITYKSALQLLTSTVRLGLAITWLCFIALSQGRAAQAQGITGATLDLTGFELTFDEEFTELSVSSRGPGTRWTAHTPWYGDFGDAIFSDPEPGFPFTVVNGVLRIEARRGDDGTWRSGLLCSWDKDGPEGSGFAQKYGYFEMRAKFPEGAGVWPAFWLIGKEKSDYSTEIDVVEHYGAFPGIYHVGVHVRYPDQPDDAYGTQIDLPPGKLSQRFNSYGVLIDPEWVTFYFNRRQVWSTPTRPEMRQPMYILLNLALGGGWPIDETPNPSIMEVAHVKVYGKPNIDD